MNKRILSYVPTFLILLIPVVGWWQRNYIFDTWRLHNYAPNSQIVTLADTTTMTDKSRRLFYVYRPTLDDKSAFAQHCGNEEQTIVLGCYIQHKGIYLYDVPDARLNGVQEVTAAHELLHAEYDRLTGNERKKVDALTSAALKSITDERLLETIENYRKKDPSVVPNELHSILGTEVRNLPPALEQHYKKYFIDRSKIVDYADDYKAEFTGREQKVADLDKQLASLKTQIDNLNESLETQQTNLKNQYDSLQRQKQPSQIAKYNAAVPGYNAAVQTYNTSVNRQRSLVQQYNAMVEERNSLAVEENQLIKALDSRDTIETQ